MMANWKSEIDKSIIDHRPVFIQLENDLGISGAEAMKDFKTIAKTFTANHQTNNRFEVEKLTQILDGKQA